MNDLIHKIKSSKTTINYNSLGEFVKAINFDELKYDELVNEPEHVGDYGRNILTLEPFECVLINWPAGVESAVHFHDGLFGYVFVLEGELDNVSYRFEGDKLIEYAIDRYGKKGLMPEPDGVIHKLRNNSTSQRAITLHFYYPAIHSFEGMEIYHLEKEEIGILSDQAKTAKWSLEEGHFKEVRKNAFDFVSFEAFKQN